MTVNSREKFVSLPAALVEELLDTLRVSGRRRLNVEEKQAVIRYKNYLTKGLESVRDGRMAFPANFIPGMLRVLFNCLTDERVVKKLLDLLYR